MLQMPTPLMSCDSGAGGRPRCYDRGVSGGPPEPQLERPEGCALPEGEGIRHQQVHTYEFCQRNESTHLGCQTPMIYPGTTAGQPSDVSVEDSL